MDYEKLTGELFINDVSELVNELNLNKNKFRSLSFDRRGDFFTFEIVHYDPKDQKKLYKIIEKFLVKTKKGTVNRQKDGVTTDRREKE